MKILLFYICFLLITKVQANNYIIKKSTEDISFLDHEKRQEFELVSFSKRDPFPKISIGSSGSGSSGSSSSSDSNSNSNPNSNSNSNPNYESNSISLQSRSQTSVKTSTEDIALYLINQMGNKAEDVIKQEVVDWAKKNGYSDKEADKIGEEAKRLVKCMKNTAISLLKWEFNMTKNASCISCKQINSLSNIHTNSSQINGTAAIESLKLLYSIKSTIDDAGKCKFNLECMNTYANDNSCLQSLSSGSNSNSNNNFLITIGIMLEIVVIMII
ncbi:hypothetical protein C2G38_1501296 [Gigaspora rosea]|uniref:Uncharacterized protein n=1 Tax=Gigaspora rosea TaxID=44941 RepID=A0A397V5G0_9GLOM|nr:hypothetical protein C2G38_1501296 [Gigaspora rosea]